MQATLFVLWILPPPAPGSKVLARLYCSGAGCTPDTGIIPIVQSVIRNTVFSDIGPDL
ncbi:hypothetical protein HKBW3S06_01422, partial [Candidatus Hakubella thermalkaliphila]